MGYAADPNKLYNMTQLQKSLEDSECFVVDTVESQATAGIRYPLSFYGGLAMGGAALLYVLFRR
jgi:hypothetical protein